MNNIYPHKIFWRSHELPVADYLKSLQKDLADDFVRGFDSLEAAAMAHTHAILDRRKYGISLEYSEKYILTDGKPNVEAWRALNFRYEHHTNLVDASYKAPEAMREVFPTVYKIIDKYGDICPIINYSLMAPRSELKRHTGPENRTGEWIRVHLPLIIPEGDLFFEADSQVIDWSDVWGFHNQVAHGAYNYSDEWRLILLIDFHRESIGLGPGMPFDEKYNEFNLRPFVRPPKE